MKYADSNSQVPASPRALWLSIIAAIALAALVGLGTWAATSLFRSSDSVTVETSELTASQHIAHLVRALRISAAADITPTAVQSIPAAAAGTEPVACGSRYTQALDQAVLQFHGIDYFSTVAGARLVEPQTWRAQQAEAHDGALALQRLFPTECAPTIPVNFGLSETFREADGISVRHMLKVSDDLVEEWAHLYLLAETADERELALAGLWQVITWEADWQPGRSPFAWLD